MSFERIGPYDLTRADLVAASIIIPFVTAAKRVRLTIAIYILAGLLMVVIGIAFDVMVLVGLGIWLILWVFVLAPALRSRKRNKNIYLEYNPEGIVGETPLTRTTYKWSTIGNVRKVGSRLFIMISDNIALVVPERATTPENIDRVVATLSREGLATDH
jgi:hypothetical protein